MCLIKMPRLKGNSLELDSIVIIPLKGESIVCLKNRIEAEIMKRARPWWFLKPEPKRRGKIKIRKIPLSQKIKKGRIKISITRWLHNHIDPNPQKARRFFEQALIAATGGTIIYGDIEPATPEETLEIINRFAREASHIQSILSPKPPSFSFSFSRSCLLLVFRSSLH